MARKTNSTGLEPLSTTDITIIERISRLETLLLTIIEDFSVVKNCNNDIVKLDFKVTKLTDLIEVLKKELEEFDIKSKQWVEHDDSSYYLKHKKHHDKEDLDNKKRRLDYGQVILAIIISFGTVFNIVAPIIKFYIKS